MRRSPAEDEALRSGVTRSRVAESVLRRDGQVVGGTGDRRRRRGREVQACGGRRNHVEGQRRSRTSAPAPTALADACTDTDPANTPVRLFVATPTDRSHRTRPRQRPRTSRLPETHTHRPIRTRRHRVPERILHRRRERPRRTRRQIRHRARQREPATQHQCTTLNVNALEDVSPGPDSVADACTDTDPANTPVRLFVATPPTAATEPDPDSDPTPADCPKLTLTDPSGPDVTVFPNASITVAENDRAEPAVRSVTAPDSEICDAAPCTTLNVNALEDVSPGPDSVADACTDTDPANTPVRLFVATPPTAATEPDPDSDPTPADCPKLTLTDPSGPDVTVFPNASTTVAENDRAEPAVRSVTAPVQRSGSRRPD